MYRGANLLHMHPSRHVDHSILHDIGKDYCTEGIFPCKGRASRKPVQTARRYLHEMERQPSSFFWASCPQKQGIPSNFKTNFLELAFFTDTL